MPYDAIVSDWNGCLIEDRDEGRLWKAVTYHILDKCFSWPPSLGIATRMLMGKGKLERLAEQYKNDEIDYANIYEAFNPAVLKGVRWDFVYEAVNSYAESDETQSRVQGEIILPIIEAYKQGKKTYIVSTGLEHGIDRIIREFSIGEGGVFVPHQFYRNIHANHITCRNSWDYWLTGNTAAVGFDLRYVHKNKAKILGEIRRGVLGSNGIKGNIVVLGDTEEDEPMFQGEGVIPVVSHLADPDFAQHCAVEHGAEVLEKEEDLGEFLRKSA